MVDYRYMPGKNNNNNESRMTYGQGSRQGGSPYFSWENDLPAPVDRTAQGGEGGQSTTPPATYTDPNTGQTLVWDSSTNKYLLPGQQYEGREKEQSLGDNAGYMNDLITEIEASGNTELSQFLKNYAMGGLDPTSQDSITKLQESASRIAGLPSYYSPEEEGRVSGMITGSEFDKGVGTNIRGQITRAMAPQRESLRSILGATGQAGNPDAIASSVMNVADESNRTFQDVATKYLTDMFNSGVGAREKGENAMMGRETLMGNINEFIPSFTEGARAQRAGVGTQIKGQDQQTLMQLLQTLLSTKKQGGGNDWLTPVIEGGIDLLSDPKNWALLGL